MTNVRKPSSAFIMRGSTCVINFGAHKGKDITTVPRSYFQWCRDQRITVPTDREIDRLSHN